MSSEDESASWDETMAGRVVSGALDIWNIDMEESGKARMMRNTEKTLYIGGMTCVNCKHKIEHALRAQEGIQKAEVDYRTGIAHITYDRDRIRLSQIRKTIEALDYTVSEQPVKKEFDLADVIMKVAIIVLLYQVLARSQLLNVLAPGQLAESGMSYGMLFVIGLLTSVHCIAMCGGINLSQSLPTNGDTSVGTRRLSNDRRAGAKRGGDLLGQNVQTLRPALLYNAGRVLSYTMIGAVLGTIGYVIGGGAGVAIPTSIQGAFKIIVGAVMVLMAVNLLGIFPALRRLQVLTSGRLGSRIYGLVRGHHTPFIVGLINGLMPCGPLQAMWIIALAAASPVAGALSMLAFALGTVPLMLGLGSVISLLGRRFAQSVTAVGAILVAVMGLAMISQGGALAGVFAGGAAGGAEIASASVTESEGNTAENGSLEAGSAANEDAAVESETASAATGEVQYIESTLMPGTYPTITVQPGVPVEWTINVPQGVLTGCNYRMIVPGLGFEYTFQEGKNVIEFIAEEEGTIPYTCWMGMIRGTINVES